MLRGALHIAVIVSFLWLPLNRRHNIVLVYPAFEVVGWADGVYVPLHSWRRDVQWTGGAAALDTARPFQAIDNALQAAGAPRIQWDVLLR